MTYPMTIEKKRLEMEERLANLENWLDSALEDDTITDEAYEAVRKEAQILKKDLHNFEVDILAGKYDGQEEEPETKEPETFAVWEGHMENLRKKVAKIQNKCKKYGCDFSFEEVGEEIREVVSNDKDPITGDPIKVKCKFILVQAEGTAVINGWEFVASVEHTKEGNIFSKAMTTVEIPERYRNTECICEHCRTKRIRKNTSIIRNTETGEFKQIGDSCLKDYTHGMSATFTAWYASVRTIFEDAEDQQISFGSMGWWEKYYNTKEILQYTAETIRHFGYSKTENRGDSTRDRMQQFFDVRHGNTKYWEKSEIRNVKDLMEEVGFDPDSVEAVRMTEEAMNWIGQQEASNDYMHNLKVATSLKETTSARFGLLVSLFPTWNRELEKEAQRKAEAEAGKKSQYVGQVGDRIDVQVESVKCLTSWESNFGYYPTTTYIWKIVDREGNIYTWKTSKWLNEEHPPVSIKGTVKEHKDFREVHQTELTRCKIA